MKRKRRLTRVNSAKNRYKTDEMKTNERKISERRKEKK